MKKAFIVFSLMIAGTITIALAGNNTPGQSASPAPTPATDTIESVKEYLLTSSATDFIEHQPPFPKQFRNVRLGHVVDQKNEPSYRLCGEFLPEEKNAEWTGFVTIKTSKYEQYIGSGTTFCTDPKMKWDTSGDLAATLKARLDSVKQAKEQ